MLSSIQIKGFKTIREVVFQPRALNVLIGANGAGKSNLIAFFRLMNWMAGSTGGLQEHVAIAGGANKLLHGGAALTPQIDASLEIATENGQNEYAFRLFHAAEDTLMFADERYRFSCHGHAAKYSWNGLGAGHRECALIARADQDDGGGRIARFILSLLRQIRVFQFHNTSSTARMRQKWSVADGRYLKEDAANLGAFLLRLQSDEPKHYRRIVETIRLILPFFDDFALHPSRDSVLLSWKERHGDLVLDASQASDGMLRTFALVSLLGQPAGDLPETLILDEPELGLHPYAISTIAGMLRSASQRAQIFAATQSASLIDQFQPEEVVVVEREGNESRFRRLDSEALGEWLEEYSLGELWLKNLTGGRPAG
ncbi:AAA family ATPase [Candidatus Poribacteria bacterium]|nr:AAA family ATPase [Candidatus Poribacteria bacterium]